jgi:hypothetical protein
MNELADGTCEMTKSDGERCRSIAMESSHYCFFHNPDTQEARKAAQRRGGQANGPAVLPTEAADLTLGSGKDVSVFLAETINQVRKGRLSPKIATTVGYLTGLLMKALETTDIEKRIARLELALPKSGPGDSLFNPDDYEDVSHENGTKPEKT